MKKYIVITNIFSLKKCIMTRKDILSLGALARAYLQIVEDSNIESLDKNYLVAEMKTNLQNMRDASQSQKTRELRTKIAETSNTQYKALASLQKQVEISLQSDDVTVKNAAEKISTVFTKKITEVRTLSSTRRKFYLETVSDYLAVAELKPAIELLKLQVNTTNFINAVKSHVIARNEYLNYCNTEQEANRAGVHKKKLEANISDFNKMVAVKAKEPNAAQWIAVQELIVKNKELYHRQQMAKAQTTTPETDTPAIPAAETNHTPAQSA
jgi:hypothetical protein